jgi:uncharacterized membrane protein (DUF106 family)
MDEDLEKEKSVEENLVENKKPQENQEKKSDEISAEKEEIIPIVPKNKEGKIRSFLKGKNKEPSWKPFIFVMIFSSIILFFWDNQNFLIIKESIHAVLDPSAGALLNWNLTIGMTIIVFAISLITTLAQKYCTDQETIKELRKEQKIIQEKSKEFKDHPEKMMEIQKEIMPLTMKTMKLSMRSVMFTGIPFILFFNWFRDFFTTIGDPKFFGVLTWFWFYFIAVMIFSGVLRKLLKVV